MTSDLVQTALQNDLADFEIWCNTVTDIILHLEHLQQPRWALHAIANPIKDSDHYLRTFCSTTLSPVIFFIVESIIP